MKFLRNTWYCAGWSQDLIDTPKAIKILNEPVVLYRGVDGTAIGLEDRCPHRFAPLSKGKIQGDNLACGYHGLVFDAKGNCAHNPHGDGSIPKGCSIKHYPVVESQGVIWIWMGEPDKADSATIIDIGECDKREGWASVHGSLHVNCHYELISDNLLDLSHVPYLHSFLAADTEPPEGFEVKRELKVEGDTVWSMHWNHNCPVSPLFALLWDEAPAIGTLRAHMRWQAPSVLYQDTGFSAEDGTIEDGASFPGIHLITPETDQTSHYFYAVARNRKLEDTGLSEGIRTQVNNAFEFEDEPMIEACHELMPGTDLLEIKPVYLPGDMPGMRARRTLQKLIQAEESE